MKSWNEGRPIDLFRAAGSVAKSDDVGAGLPQPAGESKLFGVIGQRHETCLAVAVVAHQDGEFSARCQDTDTIIDKGSVACEELPERLAPREVIG